MHHIDVTVVFSPDRIIVLATVLKTPIDRSRHQPKWAKGPVLQGVQRSPANEPEGSNRKQRLPPGQAAECPVKELREPIVLGASLTNRKRR